MEIITLEAAVTASGKYKERLKDKDYTNEVQENLKTLLISVNALLSELGISKATVSSGYRPESANAAAGGAKKSNHKTGHAIDLVDSDGKLDAIFEKNIKVLEKHGLYLESPKSTVGWSHLQNVKTKNNPFLP